MDPHRAVFGALSHVNLTLLGERLRRGHVRPPAQPPDDVSRRRVLGLADSYAIGYISSGNDYFSTFRFVIPAVFLFVVLLAMPNPQLRTGPPTHLVRRSRCRPGGRIVTAAAVIGTTLVLASILSEADALRASKIFGIAPSRCRWCRSPGSPARCRCAR